jgi:putative colanic acid biosynthesis glycosyltransferase WcaI
MFADRIVRFRPNAVVAANMPLDILNKIMKQAGTRGIATVFWMQDIYSAALSSILVGKYGAVGRAIASYYRRIERRVLEGSDCVVVISPDFRGAVTSLAPTVADRITVIPNWAPLDEVVPRPKVNPWSRRHGIADRRVVLYSGTLGHKHDPRLLLETAERLRGRPEVRVVVVSEGPGVDWLASEARARDLRNLAVFPFQPFNMLSNVLASADIVVAMLESDAGIFSVPSKILSYMCAGKPIVLLAPKQNLSSTIICHANAGFCHNPTERQAFKDSIVRLLEDRPLVEALGRNARHYAEASFDIVPIADRFSNVLQLALSASRQRRTAKPIGSKPTAAFCTRIQVNSAVCERVLDGLTASRGKFITLR